MIDIRIYVDISASVVPFSGGGASGYPPGALAISGEIPDGVVGQAYFFAPTVTGGVPPYLFDPIGTVPVGLTLDAETGALQGVPAQAGALPGVRVRDTQADQAVLQSDATVQASLGALTVSPSTATVGVPYTGEIFGRATGSTLALTGAGSAGLSVNSTTGAVTGTPTTAGAVNIVETLAGAVGSPRTTPNALTTGAAISLAALTVTPSIAAEGVAYTGTVAGKTAGSTLTLSGAGAAGLSVSGSTITGTPTALGPVNIIETLAGATNSPRMTTGAVTIAYVPTGTLVAGFEATNEWSQTTSKIASLDPEDRVQGTTAVKYSPTATSNALTVNKTITALDPLSLETYAFYVKLDTDIDWQSVNTITASFLVNAGGTVYPGASKSSLANVWTDGLWVSGNISSVNATFQNAGVGNHGLRIATTETNALVGEVVLDGYGKAVNADAKTPVVITFDDAKPTQYSIAHPALVARGLKATYYIPTANVLDGGTDTMTAVQIQEIGNSGYGNIQINGTPDDQSMTSYSTVAAWVGGLNQQADVVEGWGLPRPTEFGWTFGFIRQVPTRVNLTGINLTSGTDTLALASTTGITVGMRAVLIGVSKACRVIAVNPGVSVQLSEQMTLTATSKTVSFIDDSHEFHGNKPTDAAIAAGYKWARSTINTNMFVGFGFSRRAAMQAPSYGGNGQTGAALLALLDTAIAQKAMISFYIHGITSGELPEAEFIVFLDGVKARVDAGLIEVTTFSEIEAKYGSAVVPY